MCSELQSARWTIPLKALVACAILWSLPAMTADEPDEVSPYGRDIHQVEGILRRQEGEMLKLTNDFENLGDFGKSDARLVQEDYAKFFQTCREAIAAYRRGDIEAARSRRKECEESSPDRLWRRRYGARDRQAQNWPPEQWVFDLETQKADVRTKAHAPVWVATRRRASLAWARLAEAIVPGADEDRLIELEDQAYAAEAEVHAAGEIWTLYIEVYYRAANPKVQSPELTAKLQSVERWADAIKAINRDRAEVERRQREWDRTRKRLNQEIAEAYERAWKEADRRARMRK